ncbi:MAG: histidine phosphatase family protein [Hyphomicrobiaceae bacterium]|nr:histidine phosphatase family protein [Hyphomicrobiaceae bacterium]
MSLLIFVRHGQTDWNRERRLQGQRDIPLNNHGRSQARDNGRAIARWLEARGMAAGQLDFVSSPMGRARETMEIVRAGLGLPPKGYRVDDRLKEITFGDWEGFTLPELMRTQAADVERRERDKWETVPPAGESYEMLYRRIHPWYGELARPTLAVAHGGVWRALQVAIEGHSPETTASAASADVRQDRFIVVENGRFEWI